MTVTEVTGLEIATMADSLGKQNGTDGRVYLMQISDAYAAALEVRRQAGFVLVPVSAISHVREACED